MQLDSLTTAELERKLSQLAAVSTLRKATGLRKLRDLLLIIGQPERSHCS